jgi:hypothetical protein
MLVKLSPYVYLMLKYKSLKDFLDEQKQQELYKKRLAEKLYYTVKKEHQKRYYQFSSSVLKVV